MVGAELEMGLDWRPHNGLQWYRVFLTLETVDTKTSGQVGGHFQRSEVPSVNIRGPNVGHISLYVLLCLRRL